ncbi:Cytochrome P450 4V2 [Araneus ventricosus]|uniref:Cytochrome P450 4V2 n=1 Tax=Araneus ventricosus TaxID=182803 RepID=A0A4Y2ETG7_ARAVE|nr:Cytochrome P450 4V2 [Araneus ventricosus]
MKSLLCPQHSPGLAAMVIFLSQKIKLQPFSLHGRRPARFAERHGLALKMTSVPHSGKKGLKASVSYEKSKPRRKALVPCFHSDILRSFVPVFSNEAQKLVNVLQKETNKDFTDIVEPVSLCAVDITCETLFGITIDALGNKDLKSPESFSRASKIYMSKIISPWHWIDIIFRNTKVGKEFHYNCDELQKLTRNMIEEKKKRYLRGEKVTQVRKHKALMELLLDGQELSEEEIEEEMNTFALAGHINTTATVRWALYLIGLYPDVQAKVHEEIDYVFGEDFQRPVTDEDLNHLQYLDCVLKPERNKREKKQNPIGDKRMSLIAHRKNCMKESMLTERRGSM